MFKFEVSFLSSFFTLFLVCSLRNFSLSHLRAPSSLENLKLFYFQLNLLRKISALVSAPTPSFKRNFHSLNRPLEEASNGFDTRDRLKGSSSG